MSNTTRFYITVREIIKPTDHHIIFPLMYNIHMPYYYSWLINLSENELQEIDIFYYEMLNFQNWNHIDNKIFNFLISKHVFTETRKKITWSNIRN